MADNMMKALLISNDKSSKIVEIPKPFAAKGQVIVQVKFSALDTATLAVLDPKSWLSFFLHAKIEPLILGWHFSGTVVELGPGVKEYETGHAVWGHLQYEPGQKQGSFSEYIAVDVEACALKPKNVSLEQCAAAATECTTALQALRDKGGLEEDMSVLILGAAGAVGNAAVGIAKKLGATRITAVCSAKDIPRVLGADRVLNKSQDPFAGNTRYHVIFDTPSVLYPHARLSHLYHGGAYVSTLPSWSWLGGCVVSLFTSKSVSVVHAKSTKDDLELIGEWLQEGLTEYCKIDSQFKIKDMRQALARYQDRSKTGRVVLQVEGGWS